MKKTLNKIIFVSLTIGLTFNSCKVFEFTKDDDYYNKNATTYVTKLPNKTIITTMVDGKVVQKLVETTLPDGTILVQHDPSFLERLDKQKTK